MNPFIARTTIWHGKTDSELNHAIYEKTNYQVFSYALISDGVISVDRCLILFKSHGCQWQLWNDYKEYFCQIEIFKGDNQFPIAFTLIAEDTPARAMCVAFLCWLKDEK